MHNGLLGIEYLIEEDATEGQVPPNIGIYIIQNTMVGGGGNIKIEELGGGNIKWERKTGENYIKNGENGLKNAPFWVINSKINLKRGGGRRRGGGVIEMHNIYPCPNHDLPK